MTIQLLQERQKSLFALLVPGVLIAAWIFVTACSGRKVNDSTVLARVGDRVITAKDFRIGYELQTPQPGADLQPIAARKENFLRQMVENQLLAQAGLDRGLDQNESVQRVLKWYEKQAVIRELYKDEVHNKVSVSDAEARTAYELLNEKLLLRQFLATSDSAARKIQQRLSRGETFEQIAYEIAHSDTDLQRMLTPKEFTWGELDQRLETAGYGLNPHEISAPININGVYHFLQLVNRKKNLMLTEYGYQERRHYVETIIRRRKEAELARQYARHLMEKLRPRANGPVLRELSQRAKNIVSQAGEKRKLPPYLQVQEVRSRVPDLLDKPLVVFNGGSWTVGEVLERIQHSHPEARPDLANPGQLAVALSVMVRDEFLAQEGYKRGLEKRPAVQEEVSRVRDEIVARQMKNALLDSIAVSETEVQDYFREHLARYQTPERVRIREIMVRERPLADSLHRVLAKGADMAELARQFSVRKWAAKKGGDLGYFPREAFGDLGKAAFQLPVGALSEPVPIKVSGIVVGYSVFRVLDRQPVQTPDLASIYERVSADALAQKKQQHLQAFLDSVKQRHRVAMNVALLDKIQTTDATAKGRAMQFMRVTRR